MFNCVTTPGNINYLSVCWLPMFVVVMGKPPMEVPCEGMSVFICVYLYTGENIICLSSLVDQHYPSLAIIIERDLSNDVHSA